MNRFYLLGILFISLSFAQIKNAYIESISKNVSLDSLLTYVKELSGEVKVRYENADDWILSRYATSKGNDIAREHIKKRLQQFGLTVKIDTIGSIHNILATQIGTKYPEKYFIICGHYDSTVRTEFKGYAPGADDNASGTSAVLEAARILKNYQLEYSIIYALWDEEELGLLGSKIFAGEAKSKSMDIQGVINLDMIASDTNNDLQIDIHYTSQSLFLRQTYISINSIYEVGLNIDPNQYLGRSSDHAPFWDNNYPAILVIEDASNFNPNYHSEKDIIQNFNNSFFYKNVKLAIMSLAHLATVVSPVDIKEENNSPLVFQLKQNYPNPFNPSTTVSYQVSEPSYIRLKIYDSNGREVETLYEGYQNAGTYQKQFTAKNTQQSSGVYYCRLLNGTKSQSIKMILLK